MWSTRSVNNITVNGRGQLPHSSASKGRIRGFRTSETLDLVVGEAGEAYRARVDDASLLDRFTRTIVFVKPDLVIVYDCLSAREESTFDYWLHATHPFQGDDPRKIHLTVDDVHCAVSMLKPDGLELRQTNEYDPNPRPRIQLREWHLTASTPRPTRRTEFVATYQAYRAGEKTPPRPLLEDVDGGYVLRGQVGSDAVVALLPNRPQAAIRVNGLTTTGKPLVQRRGSDGSILATVSP
jgi:hypothetical protein